jgi:hypothetical protein
MDSPHVDQQEQRTERGTVMLSKEEKRALRFVADAFGVTESDLLRRVMPEIMEEHAQMRAKLGLPAESGSAAA